MELNARPLTTRYPNTTDLHFPFGKSSPVVTLAMRRTPRGLILAAFATGLIRAVTPPNGQRLAAELELNFSYTKLVQFTVQWIHYTGGCEYRSMLS
jgi:hypothetical protein